MGGSLVGAHALRPSAWPDLEGEKSRRRQPRKKHHQERRQALQGGLGLAPEFGFVFRCPSRVQRGWLVRRAEGLGAARRSPLAGAFSAAPLEFRLPGWADLEWLDECSSMFGRPPGADETAGCGVGMTDEVTGYGRRSGRDWRMRAPR